jgi:hypothetical protein
MLQQSDNAAGQQVDMCLVRNRVGALLTAAITVSEALAYLYVRLDLAPSTMFLSSSTVPSARPVRIFLASSYASLALGLFSSEQCHL